MNPEVRAALNAYFSQIAALNGVVDGDVSKLFNVTPAVQQTLENKIQESTEFLKRINIIGVRDQEGEKVSLSTNKPIAGRTNTDNKDRQTRDVLALENSRYRCVQTNFDTHITYKTIDAWAAHPDFQVRLMNHINTEIALNRIMIGFNGTHVAEDTNLDTYPLLQDVNIGWLQSIRDKAPQRNLKQSGSEENKVFVGEAGEYKNYDALVMDAVSNLLDPWYRNSTDLVAIVGQNLLDDKYFPVINKVQPNSEHLAGQVIVSQKRIGGINAVQVPYFPDNTILVTKFENLSLYWQRGSARRAIIDNPRRDRIENFMSSNDSYVVEDFGCAALIDNITKKEA